MRGPTAVMLLLLALMMGGCSLAPKLAYNHADRLIRGQIQEYVDLDQAQSQVFEQGFAEIWQWHRSSELPSYAGWLETQAAALEQGEVPDADRLSQRLEQMQAFADAVAARITPLYRSIVPTLSDPQVGQIAARLAEDVDEERQHLHQRDDAQAQQHRAKRFIKSTENWVGRLNPAQRARVDQWAGQQPRTDALSLTYQQRRNQAYLQHLQTRHQADFVQRDEAFDQQDRETQDPELGPVLKQGQQASLKLYAELLTTLDARQRQHLIERLRRYARIARELAEQG